MKYKILTESAIDDRTALLLHSRECADGAASFRLCARPLFQEPGNVPHAIAHCLLREGCSIWRANPVRLECVFEMGAAKKCNGYSPGSLRQCIYLARVVRKIVI